MPAAFLTASSTVASSNDGQPGGSVIDALIARWSAMPDLPLEETSTDSGASVSPEEEAALPLLRAAMLKRLGITAPPAGFHSHHFSRWKLLSLLRARAGDPEAAADRFAECLPAVDAVLRYARAYEAAPAENRRLREQFCPAGVYGCDKRGAPVMYSRLGVTDTPGLVRETSLDFYIQSEFYHNLLLWDALVQQSIAKGVALQGMLFVIDISGCYTSQAYATYSIMQQMVSTAIAVKPPVPPVPPVAAAEPCAHMRRCQPQASLLSPHPPDCSGGARRRLPCGRAPAA